LVRYTVKGSLFGNLEDLVRKKKGARLTEPDSLLGALEDKVKKKKSKK